MTAPNPDALTLNALFGLSGKTALVTGSSRGIGAAIAQGFAHAGAEVFVHGTSPDAVEARRAQIATNGAPVHGLVSDLSQKGAGAQLVDTCVAQAGQLDILVINASAQINADLGDLTADDLQFQFDVNIRASVEMLQSALPQMAARGWGRVVSIGSINQSRPKGVVTAYAATKAAQHNLIQSQARDYAASGVVLNTLSPGLIDTDRNKDRKENDPEGWAAYTRSLNWMGRAGTADEMVGAAVFLASDAASFMTGETVVLSGGF